MRIVRCMASEWPAGGHTSPWSAILNGGAVFADQQGNGPVAESVGARSPAGELLFLFGDPRKKGGLARADLRPDPECRQFVVFYRVVDFAPMFGTAVKKGCDCTTAAQNVVIYRLHFDFALLTPKTCPVFQFQKILA